MQGCTQFLTQLGTLKSSINTLRQKQETWLEYQQHPKLMIIQNSKLHKFVTDLEQICAAF